MNAYNAPFFNMLSAVFLLYKKEHGEQAALKFIRTLFAERIGPVYEKSGFSKGSVRDFCRVVKENDDTLGLRVTLDSEESKIIYRFYTDPFPSLKGTVNPRDFDATYIQFKIDYILGPGWSHTITSHLWKGDPYTEHVIEKR